MLFLHLHGPNPLLQGLPNPEEISRGFQGTISKRSREVHNFGIVKDQARYESLTARGHISTALAKM